MKTHAKAPAARRKVAELPAVRQQAGSTLDTIPAMCVVGVGAGAGSVESLARLVRHLPAGAGIALVLITRLPAEQSSGLAAALARVTAMPIATALHGAPIEPDHIYLAPPGAEVRYAKRCFEVVVRDEPVLHAPIDVFLRSLATARRDLAVGVILSGHGSDGAIGVTAIKAGGGITFVEDARSARHDGMPKAAIGTGGVDFMMPPAGIAEQIADLAARVHDVDPRSAGALDEASLSRIFATLRAARGVDFSAYRRTMIRRRVTRRMQLARVAGPEEYAELLQARPQEVEALYRDLLVRVTHFFRDPEVFAALARTVLPELVQARRRDEPIRVWVPGCATGEEVYSIAIALTEAAEALGLRTPFQIFGTDVDAESIEKARNGVYLENVAVDVSPERLARYFTRVSKHHQVARAIRDTCIFARQDLTGDPPFSRVDLVSCRNVLLYFGPELRRRVLPVLAYALKPGGVLVLGASETVDDDLFTALDPVKRIYTKRRPSAAPTEERHRARHATEYARRAAEPAIAPAAAAEGARPAGDTGALARELAVAREHLDLSIERQEVTNEELRSANEELLSSNEELQSINEELSATQEELTLVNEELSRRNLELSSVNDDLSNVLSSVSLPIVIVSREQRILRATPQAERMLSLIRDDVGRPLGDLKLRIDVPDLKEIIRDVIDAAGAYEREVRDAGGRWYSLRVRPYLTADHRIEGAVLLLVDVDGVMRGRGEPARNG